MEKFSLRQAENEADNMQKKIKSGEAENYLDAEQIVEADIQKNIEQDVNEINKDSEKFKDDTRPEFSGTTMDSHSLCHSFEQYGHGNGRFSFLNHPQSFKIAEELLNRHITDRINKQVFWCDQRIVEPILEYNINNVTNLDKFSFKPDCLMSKEYQKLYENKAKGQSGCDEFGEKHELMHNFIKSKTPKDFILSLIKSSIKIPTSDPRIVLNIINQIKDDVDKNELDSYVAKFYSTEGKSNSAKELIENIQESEKAMELEKGIFVDVDGTLVVDGKLNTALTETLKKSSDRVVIFSGGDSETQTEKLRNLGFPEEFLPVVSKDKYKGKMLERLIDDTPPSYQGFDAITCFETTTRMNDPFMKPSGGKRSSDLVHFNLIHQLSIDKFNNWFNNLDESKKERIKYKLKVDEILKKIKLFE